MKVIFNKESKTGVSSILKLSRVDKKSQKSSSSVVEGAQAGAEELKVVEGANTPDLNS